MLTPAEWIGSPPDLYLPAAIVFFLGAVIGWRLNRAFQVPFDADRYFAMPAPDEKTLRAAYELCGSIKDDTTRCFFKGRLREMVRLQPVCDEAEFAKMGKDLHAEIDDCLHFGTCFRFAGPAVTWDVSGLPPGPKSIVVDFEMLRDIKRIHRVLGRLAKRYGKVFPMQIEGNPLWVVVSGAEEAKAIFHDHGATMSGRTFGQAHLIAQTDFPAGNFLRCPFSEDFKKRRGIVWREALSKQKVTMFRPTLERCRDLAIQAILRAVDKGEPIDIRRYLRMAYCNTLACILFGITFKDIDDPEYQRVYSFCDDEASEPLAGPADIFQPLRFTPFHKAKVQRMKDIRAREDAWLHEKIGARREHLSNGGEAENLCDLMLQTMDSPCPGQRLSYENIKEICNEVIFAGTDTTATSTEMVVAHLLNNPKKAETLRAELDSLFQSSERMPSAEDFERLQYTNACIKEAMRLSCAVPFNSHTCTEDTQVGNLRIPKGAMVVNNIYGVHYDPEIYPDPEDFKPERWMTGNAAEWHVENNFTFMPFGIGRRLCLGYNLALENLQLFTSSLFSTFEFQSATGKPVSMVEETQFTVSIPNFKVRAFVRPTSLVGRNIGRFRTTPPDATKISLKAAAAKHSQAKLEEKTEDGSSEKWAVWYGSQTGTAEGLAHNLLNSAAARGVSGQVRNLEACRDITPKGFCPKGEQKAIFIVSTFGNGEAPDSCSDFLQQLKAANPGSLNGLKIAVFGLGNSSYEKYNQFARDLHHELLELGAEALENIDLTFGDATKDIEADFEPFCEALLPPKSEEPTQGPNLLHSRAQQLLGRSTPPASWKVVWQSASRQPVLKKVQTMNKDKITLPAKVISVSELVNTGEINNSVVEVILDIGDATYNTADTISIYPENDPELVELMGSAMNQPLDSTFMLEPLEGKSEEAETPISCPVTLREVLSTMVDLLGRPTRRLISDLSSCCSELSERESMLQLASAEQAQWKAALEQRKLSLLQLFLQFPSLSSMPLSTFLQMVPQMRLKPRFYTIASAPSYLGEGKVALAVKVTEDRACLPTVGPRTLRGIASGFLATLRTDRAIDVQIRPSPFALPAVAEAPILMIAAGTGIAPFRGLLQERRVLAKQGKPLGEAALFFGCRTQAHFLYKDEVEECLVEKVCTRLVVAYSRGANTPKMYVQEQLVAHQQYVQHLLSHPHAKIFVCGGVEMGNAVKAALSNILAAPASSRRDLLSELQQSGRLVMELWA
mmetsp:Transcript_93926/g.205669  ORF Transcript_93926/g.205669 Transcript_93926/m.205669 type:complete len:1239 (-) Transcript_93926:361-4077(-)|eukprot:CAMPEP_0206531404 /NCGR_PEP_ID=MMETSP0325_2-20121206/3740_1 /ASSEMBLY_ACC=CAM_ASM_000347 /TAXON_ID=2866 /ORGANISM="Crypthecodinium cohnii, Strain Seligo" /LENGTH=1238 /DNA_ID=CAMNT_0054027631 /DNA_START=247 /DNA_END=3963 /DNA_ORIENTATION=-